MNKSTRRDELSGIELPLAVIPDQGPHAGLWLDKFLINQSTEANVKGRLNRNRPLTPKARLIEDVAAIPVVPAYAKFFMRWQAGLKNLEAKIGTATIQGRMAVGMGDESVLETSVKLHRTYGVPYIPGSALKGLAASYARNRIGGAWAMGIEAYNIVFGKMEEAGYVIFHDALYVPGSGPTGFAGRPLHADVITVHHKDYYGNKCMKDAEGNETLIAPADWDDPNPVPFLSATGDYLVAVSAISGCDEWIKRTWEILKRALREEGIGAKTSSGYGRLVLHEA